MQNCAWLQEALPWIPSQDEAPSHGDGFHSKEDAILPSWIIMRRGTRSNTVLQSNSPQWNKISAHVKFHLNSETVAFLQDCQICRSYCINCINLISIWQVFLCDIQRLAHLRLSQQQAGLPFNSCKTRHLIFYILPQEQDFWKTATAKGLKIKAWHFETSPCW